MGSEEVQVLLKSFVIRMWSGPRRAAVELLLSDLGLHDELRLILGAVPNEKITWGKLGSDTSRFLIERDATVVVPLMFQYVLDIAGENV